MHRKGMNEFVLDSPAEFEALSVGIKHEPALQGERFEEGVKIGSETSLFTFNNAYLPFVRQACFKVLEVSPRIGGRQTIRDANVLLAQAQQISLDIERGRIDSADVSWNPISDDELASWSDIDTELEILRNGQ